MSATVNSFHPPLIRNASGRSIAGRGVAVVATALLWTGWAYLLAAALGGIWTHPLVYRLMPIDPDMTTAALTRPIFLCIAAASFACLLLVMRLRADRRRFAEHDRRRAAPQPTDAEVCDMLGAPFAPLPEMRAARRMVVHHDPNGVVMKVDTAAATAQG